MEDFEYLHPTTVKEAVSLIAQHKGKARVIAGGQSLIPMLRGNLINPAYLIDLEGIPELGRIQMVNGGIRIGAMATHLAVATTPAVKQRAAIVAEAEAILGSPAVRNLGTIGGNLCHNEMGADPPPPLLALGATAVVASSKGERKIPIENFFKGFLETMLGEDELLVYIDIPAQPSGMASAYIKYRIRSVDRAMVGVAVALDMQGGTCREARVALGGVSPVPIRSRGAEATLKGKRPDNGVIEKAAQAAMSESRPISDSYASADYRQKMVAVFTRRALVKALGINS